MDYISILEQFKKEHIRAGEVMPFSLFPILFLELERNGFTQDHINIDFYKQVIAVMFAGEQAGLHVYALEDMFIYAERIPLGAPKAVEVVKKEEPKKQEPIAVVAKGKIISTEHLVENIPDETEEGDGLSTPIEDVINLRPEDFADYEIDWEFAESVGLKRPQS